MSGMDAVIHVAAKAGIWGTDSDYMRINYEGTRHVVDAAKSPWDYVSSTEVRRRWFTGKGLTGIDESAPYPELDEFLSPTLAQSHWPKDMCSKRMVPISQQLRSDHLIWGQGDNHLIPRLIDRAKKGRLLRVGDGTNMVDSVFVDNAADATSHGS